MHMSEGGQEVTDDNLVLIADAPSVVRDRIFGI